MSFMNHRTTVSLLIAGATLASICAVQAQTIYRIVGADGRVTFSDKPPVSADQGRIAGTGVGASGAAASAGGLPYELRQVVAKYPVTLYSSANCAPCDNGRSLLTSRGVPFTERTVNTTEDSESLQRLSGDNSLPFLTIGGQRIKGMSDVEWSQYLDAAGYPKTSTLPPSFKNAPATPLVNLQKPAAAPKAEPKPVPEPEPPRPVQGPTPSNPAGIQF